MGMKYWLLIASILLLSLCQAELSCDAYISMPDNSNIKMDGIHFDDFSLNLFDKNGVKLESGGCTQDGYCLVVKSEDIPEDMKKFTLKVQGPAGAVFEPEGYDIDLDQDSSTCEDSYAFELVGFGIEAKVVVKPTNTGAAKAFVCEDTKECQLDISLISTASSKQVATAQTRSDGSFRFPRVAPGSYRLHAQPKNGISFSKPSADCDVRLGAASDCNSVRLEIGGFELRGRAESYEEPLEGVVVALVDKQSGSQLQRTVTDAHGEYRFAGVAPGKYLLNAKVSETGAKYKIEQPLMEAEVKDGITVVQQPFVVAGLSIRGKVLRAPDGEGIKDVVIKIDGKSEATTNERGTYKLDEIVPGDYILEGSHKDYLFESMRITIEPQSSKIPDLIVSEYKLWGKLEILDSEFTTDGRSVILKDQQGHQERITAVDQSGVFCFDVKPLKYVVIPVISGEEHENGLRFNPSKLDIEVKDKPITDLKFKQIKYKLKTSINCKEKGHCNGIEITIKGWENNFSDSIQYNGKQHVFDNLLPGKYIVKVNKPEYCWGTPSDPQGGYELNIVVGDENSKEVPEAVFEHSGYVINYEVEDTIDVEIGLHGENRRPDPATFRKGAHRYCYGRQGKVDIIPKTKLYKFDKEFYTCNLQDCSKAKDDCWLHQTIKLYPQKYLVIGSVRLESTEQAKHTLIKLSETLEDKKSEQHTIKLSKDGEKNVHTFEFYASANTILEITPMFHSSNQDKMLFYPMSKTVSVHNKCITDKDKIKFEARQGLILEGSVEGGVKDVTIIVTIKNSDSVVHKEVNKNGKYNIGPLYDDQEYDIKIIKEGYNIFPHPKKENVFVAEILSYLTLKFEDEATGKPIPSVLVAVSSAKKYRNKSYSDENGIVKFSDLYSGTYNIKPILKEYKFSSPRIEIKEGEKAKQVIKGKRVAFSVYGKVSLISGDSVSNVVVQANSLDSSHSEDAFTDSNGDYRLKGLKKDTTYEVSIKQTVSDSHQKVRRSIPASRQVKVGQEDSQDINFSVLLPSNKFVLKGIVNFEDDDWKFDGGKVEVFIKDKIDSPISRQKIGLSRIFTFTGLPINMEYVLKVTPTKDLASTYTPYEKDIDMVELKKDSSKDSVFVRVDMRKFTQ